MRWKLIIFNILMLAAIVAALDIAMRPNRRAFASGAADPFLDEGFIEFRQYATTELACALIDPAPVSPGHCLIIPRRHVVRFEDLTSEEIVEISYLIRRTHETIESLMGPCDYILLQKNGPGVGQDVAHVQWHYIPRRAGQKSVLRFVLNLIFPYHSRLSEDQVRERVLQMKQAWAQLDSLIAEQNEPCNEELLDPEYGTLPSNSI